MSGLQKLLNNNAKKKKKEILELSIHMHKRTIINTSDNTETINLKLITDLNGKM